MKKIIYQITDEDIRENVSYALEEIENNFFHKEEDIFQTESEREQFITDTTEDIISRAEIYGYDDSFIKRLLDVDFYDEAVSDALQDLGK